MRPLVKGPARGGGTELLKKGRLLLLLSKALQCWNPSKWEAHWTMFSNKLQDLFPFALIKLGIVTNKSPDLALKRAFLEKVQFGIRFLLSWEMSFNIFFWNLVVIVNQKCLRIILFFLYLVFWTLLRLDILLIGGPWLTKYQVMIVIVKSLIFVEKNIGKFTSEFYFQIVIKTYVFCPLGFPAAFSAFLYFS